MRPKPLFTQITTGRGTEKRSSISLLGHLISKVFTKLDSPVSRPRRGSAYTYRIYNKLSAWHTISLWLRAGYPADALVEAATGYVEDSLMAHPG
jgi:hypothetical protein